MRKGRASGWISRAREAIARNRAQRAARRAEKQAEKERKRRERQDRRERQRQAYRERREQRKREREARRRNRQSTPAAQKRERIRRQIAEKRAKTVRRIQEIRARNARMAFWLNRVGYTEQQWQSSPIVGHHFAMPVYHFDEPVAGASEPQDRWPAKMDSHPLLTFNPDGSVRERQPGTGPGTTIDAPAWSRPWHALYDRFAPEWRDSEFARLILAGQNADGATIDGRLSIGSRIETSPYAARGWDYRLLYDGAGGVTSPDLELISKDEDATEDPESGAVVKVNGVRIGGPRQTTLGMTGNLDALDASALSPDGTLLVTSDNNANQLRGIEAPDFAGWPANVTVRLRLANVGANDFVIIEDSGDAAAGHTISTGGAGNLTIVGGQVQDLEYDRTNSEWIAV